MKNIIMSAALLGVAYAQSGIDLSGRVVDHTNSGMAGIEVYLLGFGLADTTDANGLWSIQSGVSAVKMGTNIDWKLNGSLLQFNLDKSTTVDIALVDHQGRQMFDLDAQQMTAGLQSIDLSKYEIPYGTYFLKVNVGNSSKVLQVFSSSVSSFAQYKMMGNSAIISLLSLEYRFRGDVITTEALSSPQAKLPNLVLENRQIQGKYLFGNSSKPLTMVAEFWGGMMNGKRYARIGLPQVSAGGNYTGSFYVVKPSTNQSYQYYAEVNAYDVHWNSALVGSVLPVASSQIVDFDDLTSVVNVPDFGPGLSSSSIISSSSAISSSSTLSSSISQSSSSVFSSSSVITGYSNLVIDAANFTEWGNDNGVTYQDQTSRHQVYFIPGTDVQSGFRDGSSVVLAPDGSLVGPCPKADASCVPNWNISKTQTSGVSVASKLKVTAYTPSTAFNWGEGYSGWWLLPSGNSTLSSFDAFGKSGVFGLNKAGTMIFDISYTNGKTLTFQFKGTDIDENDAFQSPPRFSYTGTGAREKKSIAVAQVKRAKWSFPLLYDAAGVTGIGMLRMELASSQGAAFPADAPVTTDFEFWGATLPVTYGSVAEIPTPGVSSSYKPSSSSVVISSSLTGLSSSSILLSSSSALVSSSSMQAKSKIVIDAANFTEWGVDGGTTYQDPTGKHQVYFVPHADVYYEGNSAVLAPDGSLVGPCPKNDIICVPNWNISKTQTSGISIASKLKVTDYVPSSAASWGWASASWWLLPMVNPDLLAPDAFGKAGAFGLNAADTMYFDLSYSAGKYLTIQFMGAGIDENDANQSPPRFTYTGKGVRERVSIRVASVRRPGWSIPTMYDAGGVTGIGFIRMEAAGSQGAPFPSTTPITTDFEFWGATLPSIYANPADIPLPVTNTNISAP